MSIEEELIAREAARRGLSITQYKMLEATPPDVMRGLREDARRSNPMVPSSAVPQKEWRAPVVRGTGWSDPVPLGPPSGINHVDRIAGAFAAEDQRERIKRMTKEELAAAIRRVEEEIAEMKARR
jgi:hypothetical protein